MTAAPSPSFLCLSQESSSPKSLGVGASLYAGSESFTAQTRRGWIPVTSTGMREVGVAAVSAHHSKTTSFASPGIEENKTVASIG
ncbi:hypothetical protein GGE66_003068 [Rhizobium leguminosarum]|nr:hypothetical protein [Rhizobium leguminosarum]MBB6222089.1 hypothetical protein [Rhizobium leguminosarum]